MVRSNGSFFWGLVQVWTAGLVPAQVGRRYPNAGYGASFHRWLFAPETGPYNSWGNGSAMRVSPIGWARHSEPEVLADQGIPVQGTGREAYRS